MKNKLASTGQTKKQTQPIFETSNRIESMDSPINSYIAKRGYNLNSAIDWIRDQKQEYDSNFETRIKLKLDEKLRRKAEISAFAASDALSFIETTNYEDIAIFASTSFDEHMKVAHKLISHGVDFVSVADYLTHGQFSFCLIYEFARLLESTSEFEY